MRHMPAAAPADFEPAVVQGSDARLPKEGD